MRARCDADTPRRAFIMACLTQRLTFYVVDGELPPEVAERAEAAAQAVLDAAGVKATFGLACDDVICTYAELEIDWSPTSEQVAAADAWVDAHCAAVDLATELGWPHGSLTCWPSIAEAERRDWAARASGPKPR